MAVREKMRSRFHGSHDLVHRLFVCISGAPSGPGVGTSLGVHRVGPQAGHGLGGTRGVGRLQAVAGTLQESPQEGSGAGPARGPSPRHFLAPSSERSPAKRWASCVRRSSLVWGWEPRPGPRALATHPRGPVQSDVLTDPVSFCPLSEGADDCFISSDSEGHERGVFFAVSLSLCIVSWCRHVVWKRGCAVGSRSPPPACLPATPFSGGGSASAPPAALSPTWPILWPQAVGWSSGGAACGLAGAAESGSRSRGVTLHCPGPQAGPPPRPGSGVALSFHLNIWQNPLQIHGSVLRSGEQQAQQVPSRAADTAGTLQNRWPQRRRGDRPRALGGGGQVQSPPGLAVNEAPPALEELFTEEG